MIVNKIMDKTAVRAIQISGLQEFDYSSRCTDAGVKAGTQTDR